MVHVIFLPTVQRHTLTVRQKTLITAITIYKRRPVSLVQIYYCSTSHYKMILSERGAALHPKRDSEFPSAVVGCTLTYSLYCNPLTPLNRQHIGSDCSAVPLGRYSWQVSQALYVFPSVMCWSDFNRKWLPARRVHVAEVFTGNKAKKTFCQQEPSPGEGKESNNRLMMMYFIFYISEAHQTRCSVAMVSYSWPFAC